MSTKQNPRVLRIVRIVLDILFGLLVIVSAFLLLWIFLSPFILNVTDIAIMSSVPVAIGSGTEPRMEVEVAGAEAKGIQAVHMPTEVGTTVRST